MLKIEKMRYIPMYAGTRTSVFGSQRLVTGTELRVRLMPTDTDE